ncbi:MULTISPECIES: urease accessory protein UreD [Niastella]|uniref:Urease accessory protein UreD n=1 Tax=Niastella soli TaxID=2821487 RepID=A0ABS3Z494_9BACT|nr:urease accessory protein UreD [Niastella soli]MBO9204990.1 urease accessory protein UreD [Niastella soli]
MKATLYIQSAVRHDLTYLKQSYYTPPFKVADITEDKKSGLLHLMLMCSSPGVLEGDDYRLKIDLEENCHLQLHTQSYQRLFPMQQGASQVMEVYLQKGATFVYIPHPVVPHKQAVFTVRNKIYLQGNNRLIWSDLLTCGRKLNGERFEFVKYHNVTDIFMQGRLIIKENCLVQPGVVDMHTIGQWEGFSHQASLIILDNPENIPPIYEAVNTWLQQQIGLSVGISSPTNTAIFIRILGNKAEPLFHCLNKIADLAIATSKRSFGLC